MLYEKSNSLMYRFYFKIDFFELHFCWLRWFRSCLGFPHQTAWVSEMLKLSLVKWSCFYNPAFLLNTEMRIERKCRGKRNYTIQILEIVCIESMGKAAPCVSLPCDFSCMLSILTSPFLNHINISIWFWNIESWLKVMTSQVCILL